MYCVGRQAQKGGLRHKVFDAVVWNDVTATLDEQSKMLKMWHKKQVSGFCGMKF